MCTLAFYFHVFPHHPLVAAANRDELLARPSAAPLQLWTAPWVYGGQDLLAGGTWLGVNEHGVIAAILNRHTANPPDPHRRSRGLLCLDALKHSSATESIHFVKSQSPLQYNPFNLLVADATAAYVVHAHDHTLEMHHLTPGVYLLTNRNLNDPECPRTTHSFPRLSQIGQDLSHQQTPVSQVFAPLRSFLASHEADPDPRMSPCIHLEGYGTCSSALLAYSSRERRYIFLFAAGSPCRTAYTEVALPEGTCASHPPSTP